MYNLLRRRTMMLTTDYFWIKAREAGATVSLSAPGSAHPELYYSTDLSSWTLWDYSAITLPNAGDKVWFYGTSGYMAKSGDNNYTNFTITGLVDIGGDISCLLNKKGKAKKIGGYAFRNLFWGNQAIIQASEAYIGDKLSHANVYVFERMFSSCTALLSAPKIIFEGTAFANCFQSMFDGCKSLEDVSGISISILTTDGSGGHLCKTFVNCSKITKAPRILIKITGTYCCLRTFENCTSLTDISLIDLSSTYASANSYERMFRGCTSLESAPVLPAVTLNTSCYKQMFYGCTSLISAPWLPAINLKTQCYFEMFYVCTSLKYIKAMFTTTPSTTYTNNWVSGVSPNGTFVKNSAATWNISGAHGIPSNWAIETADS